MRSRREKASPGRTSLGQAVEQLPLKWRLALVSFGLLAVLMAALGTVVSVTQQQAMFGNQATSLRQEAQVAARSFGPAPDSGLSLVHQLTGGTVRATVLATDGKTPLASDSQEVYAPPQVTPDPAAVASALSGPQPADSYSIATASNGQRELVVLLPLVAASGPNQPGQQSSEQQSQQPVALLELSTPTAPIDRAIAAMRFTLGVGIVVALGIAGALTIPLVNAALRPLVAMERASQLIAGGELSLRLDEPPTADEIGRLARAFNRMVAQLEAAFARQKQFVADVSHELRTPLTALGGGLEMLLLGADRGDPAASARLLRGLYAEVGRMRRLVEDLLILARLDEGRAVVRVEPMDVSTLLRESFEEAERLARGQHLQSDIAANLPHVRADGDRLRQVLLAILDNALKYTPPPGQVTLRARPAEDRGLLIEVQDTGVGIPPDDLPHVFERFYRVDPARERMSPAAGGSGLGLAIARSLVEVQGGRITIASALNEGTTVSIWLPAVPAAAAIGDRSPEARRHAELTAPETGMAAR